MTQTELEFTPALHRDDPPSSTEAAERVTPKVRGQALAVLGRIVAGGTIRGASTREIQRALYTPADPAWNKVPTRALDLARKGLAERRYDFDDGVPADWFDDGVPADWDPTRYELVTRPHPDGGRFLVYWPTDEGRQLIAAERTAILGDDV